MGSGRTSLAKSIFGLQPVASGEIRLKEKVVKISAPPDAVEAGVAMIRRIVSHKVWCFSTVSRTI